MLCRILATGCIALLIPAGSFGQTTAKTPEELTKDVRDLQQNLTTATENLTKLTEQVAKNTAATTQNAQGIERLTTVLNDELRKQQDLLKRIDELTQLQQDQLARQQAILDAITQKDTAGNDTLRLSANMEKSEEFRDEMKKVVNQSLETHGDFSIHNRMDTFQRVMVNQKEYGLKPDEILMLKVPVGSVTAQLPGQPLTNWTVGAPTYSQKVEIAPDANASVKTTTTYRPITGGVTLPWSVLSTPSGPVYLPPIYPGPMVEYYVLPY